MFELSESNNGMKCIEIKNPTKKQREFLKRKILCNYINDPDYIAKQKKYSFSSS